MYIMCMCIDDLSMSCNGSLVQYRMSRLLLLACDSTLVYISYRSINQQSITYT
jgi:hypothetical protein